MLLYTIEVYEYLYSLLFANTKTRLVHVLYVRKVIVIFFELRGDYIKLALHTLISYVFESCVL